MHSNEIENVIAEYLNNPKAEYAVMIDGEWGTGKTYFLTHSLMNIIDKIDNGKSKRRRNAYVSLYGVKSVDEISKEIFFQCFGKRNKNKVETADMVMQTASSVLSASIGVVNIDLSKAKDTLAKININNWLICFDDLERCGMPLNEVLGYMNRLVEHNKCKVIVLANEKEIGKINLSQKLEEKYQVVLSGRKMLLSKDGNTDTSGGEEKIDMENLKKEARRLFNEDFLYKTIREKVIGLTIKYEPCMETVYDSLLESYTGEDQFKKYLRDNKARILKHFDDEECFNLRTLLSEFGTIRKVYGEMLDRSYDTAAYFDEIMQVFIKYIVLFTIYYKNGGDVGKLNLTTKIGFVPLGQGIYSQIKGFKFLEKYCTTLSFLEQEFEEVVSLLRKEYEEEKKLEKIKKQFGKAYVELTHWWEMEDAEVSESIGKLREEIQQDKYSFNSYQSIIGQLMVLEYWGHDIGSMDELIDLMNQNIENSEELVDIERTSYTFEDAPVLRKKYNEYVDRLKLKADSKNHFIKSGELSQYMSYDNWAEKILDYCDKHFNDFIGRYGFIDLLDIDNLVEKMKTASVKELRLIKEIFKTVYRPSNIIEFYINDKEKIKELREIVIQMTFDGINKQLAKDALVEYLDNILGRLETEEM